MLPILIKSKFITRMLSVVITVQSICLFPLIISNGEMDEVGMNHELIHFEQQRELFIIGFYALYAYDYIKGVVKYKNKQTAYYNVRFEQEAHKNEIDLGYIHGRDKNSWNKYEV